MPRCIQQGKFLKDITLDEYQKISPLIQADVFTALDPMTAVKMRDSLGGTGFDQIHQELAKAKAELQL